jgi:hypothetical protein
MVNSANQVTTHDQNNDKASRESSNGQAQKDVRKQPDPCKCGVVSSSKEPLTTSIRDADGVIFTGRVEQGTLQKGRRVFTHVHTESENAGKVSEYKGEFEDGMFHGTGMSNDVSGCVYEGDFYRGAAHGIGKCHWAEQGWRYQGQWANDKRHGQGTCSQLEPGCEVYSGSWKDDQWDGLGTLKFA